VCKEVDSKLYLLDLPSRIVEKTLRGPSSKCLLAASGLQLISAGLGQRSGALSLVVAHQVAIATVTSVALTGALAVPALPASLNLGERFTVPHKTESDVVAVAGSAAAARDRG
jgi:hypothetical protein